jgi:hypothetical protein
MKLIDWIVFGVPVLILLGVSIGVMFLNIPWGAKGATWACFAGFAFILGRLLWAKRAKNT